MHLQVAGLTETSPTQWTLVWFVSCVDSHVTEFQTHQTPCPHIWHLYGLSSVCMRSLCVFKLIDHMKLMLHSEHLYGLSPVWTLMWLFRFPDWLNDLSHMWHLYGLSKLWILLCVIRLPNCVNRLLQTVHSNGFSPEWLRLCSASSLLLWQHLPHSVHLYLLVWIYIWVHRTILDEQRFPQWLQEYNRSPVCLSLVWTLMWLLRCTYWLNALSHMWHLCGLSPLWILLCITRLPVVVNRLLQTAHSNGFSPEWLRLCTASILLLSQHLPHSVHLYLLVWIFIWWHRPLRDEKLLLHWLQKYCFTEWRLLLWTFQLSSSKEFPVCVKHRQTLRDNKTYE